ncbi:MAG: nitrogen fixation protein NifB [Clostridiales bacterium]|nr:nitrogen fixation protein NifB [Clostridiales bacterium]
MGEVIGKEQLKEELRLKNRILVEGINVNPEIFQHLDLGNTIQEQVNAMFAVDHHAHRGINFPSCMLFPHGFRVGFRWEKASPFELMYEDGRYILKENGKVVNENVVFEKRPGYYAESTSDGVPMATVALNYGMKHIFVSYSNECMLKEKGQDYLFCNINATKDIYADAQNIKWKTARQIGETVARAYAEDNNKVTISGGFIPERREVDYYIDVAEAIQEATGLEDFNGTATIGAPADFSTYEKYKEAGYRTTATNIELWNENYFKAICPGKYANCGDRSYWLQALEYARDVFGKFRVRSTFVAGIEPKNSLLEGIEALVSEGIIALPSSWNVNVGSPLEGHRTPTADWHFDVIEQTVAIYRKYGLTWDLLENATAASDMVVHDLFRIEEGIFL